MIDWKKLKSKVLQVEFYEKKEGHTKKLTHRVKQVKGKFIADICNAGGIEIPDFQQEQVAVSEIFT